MNNNKRMLRAHLLSICTMFSGGVIGSEQYAEWPARPPDYVEWVASADPTDGRCMWYMRTVVKRPDGRGYQQETYRLRPTADEHLCPFWKYGATLEEAKASVAQKWRDMAGLALPHVSTTVQGNWETPMCHMYLSAPYNQTGGYGRVAGGRTEYGASCHAPPPVSCAVYGPGTVDHGVWTGGKVSSWSKFSVKVKCDGTADVTLRVPDTVELRNGRDILSSSMSIQPGGVNHYDGVAAPELSVTLQSTVETTDYRTGEYTGSAVIIAEWK